MKETSLLSGGEKKTLLRHQDSAMVGIGAIEGTNHRTFIVHRCKSAKKPEEVQSIWNVKYEFLWTSQ